MKVKELIDLLKTFDPEAEVFKDNDHLLSSIDKFSLNRIVHRDIGHGLNVIEAFVSEGDEHTAIIFD